MQRRRVVQKRGITINSVLIVLYILGIFSIDFDNQIPFGYNLIPVAILLFALAVSIRLVYNKFRHYE